jgi:hypothetical protein
LENSKHHHNDDDAEQIFFCGWSEFKEMIFLIAGSTDIIMQKIFDCIQYDKDEHTRDENMPTVVIANHYRLFCKREIFAYKIILDKMFARQFRSNQE